jgi:hypothetical protein
MEPAETVLPDLLPAVQALPRAEKLRLIQFLAAELEAAERVAPIEAGTAYPVWTPLEAFEAASVLLHELEKDGTRP